MKTNTSLHFHDLWFAPLDAHRDGGGGSDQIDLVVPALAPVGNGDGMKLVEPGMLEIQCFRKTCFVPLSRYRVRRAYRLAMLFFGTIAYWASIALIVAVALYVLVSANAAGGAETGIGGFIPVSFTAGVLGVALAARGLVAIARRTDDRVRDDIPVDMPSDVIVPVRKWLKEAKKPVDEAFEPSIGAQAAGGEGEASVELLRMAAHELRLERSRKARAAIIRRYAAEAIQVMHAERTGRMPLAIDQSDFEQGDPLTLAEA